MSDENNTKTCPKDCLLCHPNQRLYCAAQMSRLALERMDALAERFDRLENKVEALERSSEGVFNPMAEPEEEE